jgi:release factor glutamine methyltransferase
LEINEAYGKEVSNLLQQHDFKDIILKKDIHGKDRMLCGRKKKKKNCIFAANKKFTFIT